MIINFALDTDDDRETIERVLRAILNMKEPKHVNLTGPAPAKRRGRPPKAKDVYSIAREKIAERAAK